MFNQVRVKSTQAQLYNGIAAQHGQDQGRSHRRVREQVREVMLYLRQLVQAVGLQGGGVGEAVQPTLNVGGVTSKILASSHGWQSKECNTGCCGGQRRKVDSPKSWSSSG